MTNINNAFQTVFSQTKENVMTHDDAPSKGTYVSPTLVRIGSAAHETTMGPRSAADATFSS